MSALPAHLQCMRCALNVASARPPVCPPASRRSLARNRLGVSPDAIPAELAEASSAWGWAAAAAGAAASPTGRRPLSCCLAALLTIPLPQLQALTRLELSYNLFERALPPAVGELTGLEVCHVHWHA